MNQGESNDLLSFKREKFRVQIRHQKLTEEFKKKRRFYNYEQTKNDFLHKVCDELVNYQFREQLIEEDLNNIKLLLNVLQKAFEDEQNVDYWVTENIVKKFRFLINLSKMDNEFQEINATLIQSVFYYLNREDYQKFAELDDIQFLQYLQNNIKEEVFEIFPQTLNCIYFLAQEKQTYRDLLIQNNFEFLSQLMVLDPNRQFSEVILALIGSAFTFCLEINIDKIKSIKEYVIKSYFDENQAIRRLALEILEEIPSKLSFENNYTYANEIISSPMFLKLYDTALRTSYDFLALKVVIIYYGISDQLFEKEFVIYKKVINSNFQSQDLNKALRIQLFWAISNKIQNKEFLLQLLDSQLLDQIFGQTSEFSDNEALEFSYVILNFSILCNEEQLSKLIRIGLLTICNHLFSMEARSTKIEEHTVKTLLNILHKLFDSQDVNNELIIPFSAVVKMIEMSGIVNKVKESQIDDKLIQDFDVYF
ncbi:unnamed protein product (macronuclear) [Paramecium tetraurelia]|uniref:IBB domain-containing protein n=1 Tax=Paramecium tetraurelia TaxID=5888 RepID=A0CCW6_PARTE|nr:uncharacterized protein GSPATT00037418001 [Paramecium tetraurelia]CAK68633.1 unnamed protein product [Paramecium tetraurelia]|eukprot:XP_001436030.1 hypothetical protein (macronuclear) [Paramecium tetraurelia strain d4-2]